MALYELDDRLIYVEGGRAAASSIDNGRWIEPEKSGNLAMKARFEGDPIETDEARQRFPRAHLDTLPDFSAKE